MQLACVNRLQNIHYQLLEYSLEPRKATNRYGACPWKGKASTCQELNGTIIMETDSHQTLVREPRKVKLTTPSKRPWTEIGNVRIETSSNSHEYGPALRATKRNLPRNDYYDEILDQIEELGNGPGVLDTQLFLFG
ncbi:Hypothetical protein PHPALM_3255 [Phytophthora palmivora]|uniref:Uncharacterized protein n=1 Tax=Phytophthora palmivora TaxID=4796 RepID=A0A2P4YMU4_9STRA|nr:Hypothetical protein PHPALM_3255 [Phytophthora palmivora]